MTVQSLLANMTQKELCHWMAYYKVKNEDREKERNADSHDDPTPVDPQTEKDQLLMSQLLAMAGQK